MAAAEAQELSFFFLSFLVNEKIKLKLNEMQFVLLNHNWFDQFWGSDFTMERDIIFQALYYFSKGEAIYFNMSEVYTINYNWITIYLFQQKYLKWSEGVYLMGADYQKLEI